MAKIMHYYHKCKFSATFLSFYFIFLSESNILTHKTVRCRTFASSMPENESIINFRPFTAARMPAKVVSKYFSAYTRVFWLVG